MEYDRDSTRLSYHGWEIRSHLTGVSFDGTVAAGAMLYFEEACRCHIISCRQFADGDDAIHAICSKCGIAASQESLLQGTVRLVPVGDEEQSPVRIIQVV